MHDATAALSASKPRIGVISGEPLRALGLAGILEDSGKWRADATSWQELRQSYEFTAALLESQTLEEAMQAVLLLEQERPGVRAVVMLPPLAMAEIQALIGAGAKGYLPRVAAEAEICMAFEVVLDGSVWAPRKVLARLIEAQRSANAAGRVSLAERLTLREQDVLRWLMRGFTNREIGLEMQIEEVTVKAHLGRMLRKAGVSNRVELTLMGMEEERSSQDGTRTA